MNVFGQTPFDAHFRDTAGANYFSTMHYLDSIYSDTIYSSGDTTISDQAFKYLMKKSGKKFYSRWRDYVLPRIDTNGTMNSYLSDYSAILDNRILARQTPTTQTTGCIQDGDFNTTWEYHGYSEWSNSGPFSQ